MTSEDMDKVYELKEEYYILHSQLINDLLERCDNEEQSQLLLENIYQNLIHLMGGKKMKRIIWTPIEDKEIARYIISLCKFWTPLAYQDRWFIMTFDNIYEVTM